MHFHYMLYLAGDKSFVNFDYNRKHVVYCKQLATLVGQQYYNLSSPRHVCTHVAKWMHQPGSTVHYEQALHEWWQIGGDQYHLSVISLWKAREEVTRGRQMKGYAIGVQLWLI